MKRLSDQTLYEILEVSVEAAPEEIERAYGRAVSLYAPGSLATYTLVSADEAQLLNNRIEEAKLVLLDPDARSRYDERIGVRPRAAAPAATPPPVPVVQPEAAAPAATPWPPQAQVAAPAQGSSSPPVQSPAAGEPAPEPQPPQAAQAQLNLPAVEMGGGWPKAPAETEPAPSPPAVEPPHAWPDTNPPEPAEAAAPPPASAPLAAPLPAAPPLPAEAGPALQRLEAVLELPAEPAPAAARPPILLQTTVPEPAPEPAAPAQPEAASTPASPGTAALTGSPVGAGPAAPSPIQLRHELEAPRQLLVPEGAAWTGEMLRQVREARGLTVAQLSERTKVTRHHLENIEAERLGALPAPVYLRGILMSLARELRLDGQRVARSYLDRLSTAQATAPKR